MVVSFKLSGRGRRYHPPPPPAATTNPAAGPHAAASLKGPPPPPCPPWKVSSLASFPLTTAIVDDDRHPNGVLGLIGPPPASAIRNAWFNCSFLFTQAAGSRIDSGNAAPSDVPERNDVDPVEPDLEPSFALNLFPDGYSIGQPGMGLLSYLIGDDPKKRPYSRASKASFSDIEYGCLPPEVLHGIPCKFVNGSTVCEVRDYRFFSNGGDYSGDDFPKVNRVSLRLGTECIVNEMSSIVDSSWTYHDQLVAESIILNALQPRLNLDPTSCLKMLCHSKEIDLGLGKGRQQSKDKSLYMCASAPENCKSDEFNICKSGTVCIESEALESMNSGKLNHSSVNCPSMIHSSNAKSPAESDPNNTLRYSYTVTNNSALSDSKESASSVSSDRLPQGNEQQAQVVALQVDRENGQPKTVTVVSYKRKKSSNHLQERHELKNCSSNKTAMLNSQHSKGTQKSTGTSSRGLDLGSPKGIQFTADQTISDKDMKMKQEKPLSVHHSKNSCVETISEKADSLNVRFKERHGASVVNLHSSAVDDLEESRTPAGTSFNASSREEACKYHEDEAGTEAKHIVSKRRVSGISTISLNQELKLKRKRKQKVQDNVKSSIESNPDDTIRSSKLTNTPAKNDRKQRAPRTAPDHLLQHAEQKAQMATSQVQQQSLTVLPCKRNRSSKLLHEKDESKIHIPPSKTARLIPQNCLGLQKLTVMSNREGLELGSSKEMQVKVKPDKALGIKSMEVPQQLPLPVLPVSHICGSSKSNPCTEKVPKNTKLLHVSFKEGCEASIVDLDNSGVADLKGSVTPSVTEPQCAALNRKVSGTSTVRLNLEINSKLNTQGTIATQIKSPCESRISEPLCVNRISKETRVTGGTNSQLSTSKIKLSNEYPTNTGEPDIEKILSEVILTTQRHGLNRKAARNGGLGAACSLIPSECSQQENAENNTYIREETMSNYATSGVTSSCTVDDSHYTLCLLESQAPDDHQITVGTIYGNEDMHIATLPTCCHAEKFVDQFILLMKRDGYHVCDDKVLTEQSELQKLEDVSQGCCEAGEYAQYLMLSPPVVNSSAIKEKNSIGSSFQDRLLDFQVNLMQQQWVMAQQSPSLASTEACILNPRNSGGLQHTSRPQYMGPSFAYSAFAMDLHQFPFVQPSQQVSVDQYLQSRHDASNVFAMGLYRFPSVQPSQVVSMDQYWQCRNDVPGFSDMYGMGTSSSSYGQWRPVPTQLGSVVYQWDLPACGRQTNNSPLLQDERCIPWSELQPIGSPQMSLKGMESDDDSVTSTPVEHPMPLPFQYLPHGMC
ncbi:hypothetical protein EJB05_30317, partial [Eragrostis curvula]